MKKITFPLEPTMTGEAVADLQDGLLFLIDGADLQLSDAERKAMRERLRPERSDRVFGPMTRRVVAQFQERGQLPATGVVDEHTAALLNTALERLGAFGPEVPDVRRLVAGQVRRENAQPVPGVRVRAFHVSDQGQLRLGEDTTDVSGRYTISYAGVAGVEAIRLSVIAFDGQGNPLGESAVIAGAQPVEMVDLILPPTNGAKPKGQVEGRILTEYGLPAAAVKLRLYGRGFAGAETLIGETVTREDGAYTLVHELDAKAASLEIRAIDGSGKEIPLNRPLHDVSDKRSAPVNLVVPAGVAPIASEYQRLAADMTPHVGAMTALSGAQETADRPDLTMLNRATGWDARLIALAATAARLSADPEVGLSQEVLYGLFRAGLPFDKLLLAGVNPENVTRALKTVREAGIVGLSDPETAAARGQFETFARAARLSVPAPGSRSTYGGFLKVSGLSDDARAKFTSVYLNHQGDPAKLWAKAAEAGVTPKEIQILKRQGKLAYLTGNSDALTSRLMRDRAIREPKELAAQGFYEPEKWKAEVKELAGNDDARLSALIPPVYEAAKLDDRLSAYAEDMARKVRISYPTEVVAHMVEHDAADRLKLGAARVHTSALLNRAAARGFKLGQTAVTPFLRAHPQVATGMSASAMTAAEVGVKSLQRVYQITPSNEAMATLLSLGLTSAYDVVAVSLDVFLDRYGARFPSVEQARLVYRKAKQVDSVTYNLFTIAKKLDSEPSVFGMSSPPEVRESVKNELVKQYPTLESLFGSMDFCECEHCRSVLSPAAYLVDLLQFLDAETLVWDNFLADWKTRHNNEDYTARYTKPYAALTDRRPDIPHIPLTCENTNTALPYIDVVNEILEYYVANGKLDDKAANDTGDATKEELLAEPHHVVAEAYTALQQARYPLELPFDLWLDTVRRFSDYFETPLARVLEVFRPGDELFAPGQPYDRAAIFVESLGLSPADQAVFTDPGLLGQLHVLFGYTSARPVIGSPSNAVNATVTIPDADAKQFKVGDLCTYQDISANALHSESLTISSIGPTAAGRTTLTFVGVWNAAPVAGDLLVLDALGTLKSAKALSRRLGVTYKELVEIVQMGFVNPKLSALVILQKLGVTIHDVFFYKQYRGLLAQNPAGLTQLEQERRTEVEAFEARLADLSDSYAGVGIDPKAWLTAALANNELDDILVLADPDAGCNFDETTLRYAGGKAADAIAFLKLNLLVRLWRKLGWTIEETSRGLEVLVPATAPFDAAHLGQSPLRTALIGLAHLKWLDETLKPGKQGRGKLLTLWSDMATQGKKPLYAQLFLTRGVLRSDPVFDHPLGRYLSPAGLAAMAQDRIHQVSRRNVPQAASINPADVAGQPRLSVRYDPSLQVQFLGYRGVLTNADKTLLAPLSASPALAPLLDAVQEKGSNYTRIGGHLLALQGALGLTAGDIGAILADAGKSLTTAELSLAHVSLLYRYGLLAKLLSLTIPELIALKNLSGLDPFTPLDPDPLAVLADDQPFTKTIQFVDIAARVKESGFSIEDLEYLLRHQVRDPAGEYRPDSEAALTLMKALAAGVRAIRAEHPVPADPGSMDDDVLRQKLGLALPPDVVDRFLAMMNGTVEFTARKRVVAVGNALDPARFAGDQTVRQVSYNAVLQEQKLTCRGVLLDPEKAIVEGRLPRPTFPNPHVPSALLGELLADVQAQARAFFTTHLQKQAPNVQPATGFLAAADYDLLFAPTPAGLTAGQEEDRRRQRRALLARSFLPYLQQRLIRQFVVQTLTAQSGADSALVESLLTDTRLLDIANAGGPAETLLAAFTNIGQRGVTATFFALADASGAPTATRTYADADTGMRDSSGALIRPAGANSARFDGYLEVPSPGDYRFSVGLDRQNARAELRFDHLADPVLLSGTAGQNDDEISEYLPLKAGVPYRFSLTLKTLGGGDARLQVQGETLAKTGLGSLTLYALSDIELADRAWTLLNKVLQLTQELGLSERELRYLATHGADFANLDLRSLPTRAGDDTPAGARALFAQFLRLAGYVRLRRDLAGGTEDLIGVFEAVTAAQSYPVLAKLSRRDEEIVRATATALFAVPAFKNELAVQRLWEGLQIVERFGVSVTTLVGWTRIVGPAAQPEERFAIARDLKEAIKARFESDVWQRVAQPIFDQLRQRKRDALVAHIMHQQGFARLEQLFEYFLIDPGMEPVVQTSRIRLAIGSVQVFIQRCLLNLEQRVHPSVINAKQWEWMKRYRVWEANRKIFLFPENWLEPEFRDDKTHLFSELEGALLQGDVSSELVEDAFLNYLKKLEELARLDICAMHIEGNADPALNTLHVFGRTYSQPRLYFYRRYAHQMWTPWEPVTTEIEGDHLVPVMWRDRLHLFWVTFMEKAAPQDSTDSNAATALVDLSFSGLRTASMASARKRVQVQLHWIDYAEGQWSTRRSGELDPQFEVDVTDPFTPSSAFIYATKQVVGDEDGHVEIHLVGAIDDMTIRLASRNSQPEAGRYEPRPDMVYPNGGDLANRYWGGQQLMVEFTKRIVTEDGKPPVETPAAETILGRGADSYTLLPCDNTITLASREIASLVSPIFYQDNANTLFVEPSVAERTIEDWQEWVTPAPRADPDWDRPDLDGKLLEIYVLPEIPRKWLDPAGPRIRLETLVNPKRGTDWLVNSTTVLRFDGALVGALGREELSVLPAAEAGAAVAAGGVPVRAHSGSSVAPGATVIGTGGVTIRRGDSRTADGVNVIGRGGFNRALSGSGDGRPRSGFGPGAGIGPVGP